MMIEWNLSMRWWGQQSSPSLGWAAHLGLAPLPLCSHGGNGWCLAELPPQPRWEKDLEAEQRQEGPGVLGVMRRLTANSRCGQVGVEAHSDPS